MKPILLALFAAAALFAPLAASAQTYTVHISDFAFKPATLNVNVGDTVVFINDDGDAHTVTAVDKSFDSAGLDTHDQFKHTFANAGTYPYFCALHPYMKGTIIVHVPGTQTP
jgi:plastocyanin